MRASLLLGVRGEERWRQPLTDREPSEATGTGPRPETGGLWDADLLPQLQVRLNSSSRYPHLLLSPMGSLTHSQARQCDGPAWLRAGSDRANDWI